MEESKGKVGFVSLGCPKNLVDSEVMMGVLQRQGWEITADAADADVLVVNTCSFIQPAQQESVDTILELAELKKTGKAQRLVVAGCMVERFRGDILREMPEVDALVGTNEIEGIGAACGGAPTNVSANLLPILPQDFFDPRPTAPYLYDELTPRLRTTPRHSAYIKIAEGCDHPCTFCVIPQYRGQFRSRRFESVAAEAQRLGTEGAHELVLIGQDTTCYGDDLGLKDGLAALLTRLAAVARESEHLRWIRSLYFYPNRVTPKLLDTIAAHPQLCNYVDMPLQHASASVLKRMKRGANGDIFLKLLERIRATIPGVALRTSFIVGFPGETEADFDELCAFVEAAQFDWMGVFGYSDEDTNAAVHLDGKVPAKVIEQRRRRLMSLQKRISRRRRRAQVGQEMEILVEGLSEETDLLWQGRLESQAPEIDGKVLINDVAEGLTPEVGMLARVEITAAQDYDLIGRLV
ncbi:MAG TPA: 30S ribosomal protein S12 methylthiotransferase RimO [Terriglobales bacterium]|jgi:ribosomal protein S12 methylthiotransferase